ncbi:MAG: universal stress protein [Bryobacterales bacterium]|nr:universal stress protein [Acidobacteriota bacterium]MCB9385901.1 universal stress protein [Bryobacterales bacterium]
MLSVKKILVPVDFSDRSVAAAEHAVELAKKFGAKLYFAHFVPPSPYEYAAFDEGFYAASAWPDLEKVREPLVKRMDELLAKVKPAGEVETIVRRGDAAFEIEALIAEHKIDLAVMPTHGYGPFRRFVLGSVTAKVLHDVKIPVFTGAHVAELAPIDPEPYKRIACAIDLHGHSEEVLRWAWDLAQAFGKELVVIHAAPRVEVGGTYGNWFPPEARDSIEQGAREGVRELLAKVGCEAEVHVASAEPASYIAEAAREAGADILVIGRDAQSGPLKGLREHAMSIIRDAPCPVISV